MPEPTLSQVHVNRPLTNISQAYMQNEADYIADKLFPVVPVEKQSDLYFKYTKGDWFRDEAQLRAPATESAGGGYPVTTDSYYAPVFAFHKDVDPQVRANTDNPLNADRDATLWITHRMMLKREILVSGAALKTNTWTGSSTNADVTPSPQWNLANATPLEDLETQIWAIKQTTGRFPNRLVLGARVWQVLKNLDEIVQRIKYTQRGVVTPDLIASLIAPPGVPEFRVLVAAAIENTGVQGAADNFQFISPTKDALLLYAEPQPGIMVPSAGYIFTWTGLLGAGAFGSRISQIPMPWLGVGTVRIEGELAFSTKIVGTDLGAYFLNAVSA
jgi:hypothetical protein